MLKRSKKYSPDPYTGGEEEYIVREGDTLQSIAEEFLDDPAAYPLILSWNGLMLEEIVPGTKIYFPKNQY